MKDNIYKKETLTEKEVAYILDVSVFFLQKKRRTGSFIPYVKIGRCVRYLKKDVYNWLEEQYYQSTSQYNGGKHV